VGSLLLYLLKKSFLETSVEKKLKNLFLYDVSN